MSRLAALFFAKALGLYSQPMQFKQDAFRWEPGANKAGLGSRPESHKSHSVMTLIYSLVLAHSATIRFYDGGGGGGGGEACNSGERERCLFSLEHC